MFEWSEYLRAAKVLVEQFPTDEAMLRSAASRAYYASFNHAKRYVETTDRSVQFSRSGTSHEDVPDYLRGHGRTRFESQAAARLDTLKKLRKWADYQSSSRQRLLDEVNHALRAAEQVLTNLVIPVGL